MCSKQARQKTRSAIISEQPYWTLQVNTKNTQLEHTRVHLPHIILISYEFSKTSLWAHFEQLSNGWRFFFSPSNLQIFSCHVWLRELCCFDTARICMEGQCPRCFDDVGEKSDVFQLGDRPEPPMLTRRHFTSDGLEAHQAETRSSEYLIRWGDPVDSEFFLGKKTAPVNHPNETNQRKFSSETSDIRTTSQ